MKNHQPGIITQARLGSSRLPRKVLLPLGDSSLLALHLQRLAKSRLEIAVATTQEVGVDAIVDICEQSGVACYQGSTEDVLARYYHCATRFRFDPVIRVTSDCPLIDSSLITAALQQYTEADDPLLYLVSDVEKSFPRGLDFEIFSYSALEDAYRNARDSHQREHVTPWFYEGESSKKYTSKVVAHTENLATTMRLTVDTPKDFELIRILVETYGMADASFFDIIEFLKAHPQLCALNLG